MARSRIVLLAAFAALSSACDDVPRDAIESCSDEVRVLPATTDILVVVDDSGSMGQEQANLRQNLSVFVNALVASPIPLDFQIGVTTTDVHGVDGRAAEFPSGSWPYTQYGWHVPYPQGTLVAVDPAVLTDLRQMGKVLYDPGLGGYWGSRILASGSASLVSDFEANVMVGTLGSEKEEPFRVVQLALGDRVADGTNAGFLRSGARLGIIVLTDEDDCSESAGTLVATSDEECHVRKAQLDAVSSFVDFLDGPIAGEERLPVVAVIAGFDPVSLEPTGCDDSHDDPTRLDELLEALGPQRTLRASICDESFGPALQRIAERFVPQTVSLDGAPSNAHLLVASVHRADGTVVPCTVAAEGEDATEAGALYSPPREGQRASLTFQGACELRSGDEVVLRVICAG